MHVYLFMDVHSPLQVDETTQSNKVICFYGHLGKILGLTSVIFALTLNLGPTFSSYSSSDAFTFFSSPSS